MSVRTKAVIAFTTMLVLSVLIYVWMVIWNVGSVSVDAEAPFILTVGQVQKRCEAAPCRLTLGVNTYPLKVEKAGYFPYDTRVALKRGEEVAVDADLEFMPFITQSDDSTIVLLDVPLPAALRSTLAMEPSAYAVGNDGVTAYLMRDGGLHRMLAWDGADSTLVTTFQTLVSPSLAKAADTVLVADPDRLFMVDITSKRKELIFTGPIQAMSASPSGGKILVETEMNGLPLLSYFDVVEKKLHPLPIQAAIARTAWNSDDTLLFISFQEFNTDLEARFAEVGLNAGELAGGQPAVLRDRLMKFDPSRGSYRVLLTVPPELSITTIEWEQDQKALLAETLGTGMIRIMMSP